MKNKKMLIAFALIAGVGAGLTACSAPAADVTKEPVTPTVTKVETDVSAPENTFIQFSDNPAPTYDGTTLTCPLGEDDATALAVRVVPTDAANPRAVKGETGHFVVDCSYPASDELMDVIEGIENSQ